MEATQATLEESTKFEVLESATEPLPYSSQLETPVLEGDASTPDTSSQATEIVEEYKVILPLLTDRKSSLFTKIFQKKPLSRDELSAFISSAGLNPESTIESLISKNFLVPESGSESDLLWTKKYRVVLVGFGFAGRDVARGLEKVKNVELTIISDSPDFVSKPAIPIVSGNPSKWSSFHKKITSYVKKSTIILGKVTQIDSDGNIEFRSEETIHRMERWEYDSIVLGPGSDCPLDRLGVDKSNEETVPVLKGLEMSDFSEKSKIIDNAERVIIVGGGPVGVEIGFEIAAKRKKEVIFVVSSGFVPRFQNGHDVVVKYAKKFKNITVHDGYRVSKISGKTITAIPSRSEGENLTIEGDVVIACNGFIPNTSFLPDELLDEKKYVKVDGTLISEHWPFCFALCDINNTPDEKSAVFGAANADAMVKSIKNFSEGKNIPLTFSAPSQVALVSLGPSQAIMFKNYKYFYSGYFLGKVKILAEKSFMF